MKTGREMGANGGQAAVQDAFRLAARAEQFSAGLSLKLQKKGHGRADIKSAIDYLSKAGMLDDLRYACLWITGRIKRRADSPRQLLINLCGKGLDRATAAAALKKTLDADTELELLRNFSAKTGRNGQTAGGNSRERLRFEGFSAEALDVLDDERRQSWQEEG
ncbi:MAG: RecX family transcriptional regulator [Spirochaetaceae bacterium]|jgi:SOS response regulatory protein OraA/RecX|nr:RecX family transcriptional regulator [Spirochaetaceae bacterium]